MEKINDLKSAIYDSNSPSHELLLNYLKALAAEASKRPVTDRDWYAYEMLRPFVELSISLDDDPRLDQIIFQHIGGDLDVNTEDAISMTRTQAEKDERRKRKSATWEKVFAELADLTE